MRKTYILILIILIISVAVIAGRVDPSLFYSKQSNIKISTWKIYRNDELGFEMKIPSNWKIFKEEYGQPLPSPYGEVMLGTASNLNWQMKEGILVEIAITNYEDYFARGSPPLVQEDTVLIDGMSAKRRIFYMKGGGEERGFIQAHGFIPQPVREYIVDAYNSHTKEFYHFSLESVGKSASGSGNIFDALLTNFKFSQ